MSRQFGIDLAVQAHLVANVREVSLVGANTLYKVDGLLKCEMRQVRLPTEGIQNQNPASPNFV